MFLGPKPGGVRHVPVTNRNGQLPTSPSSPSATTESNKESSLPALPVRKTSSPTSLDNEITENNNPMPKTVKAVVPPPVKARKHTAPALLDCEVVNTNTVPAVVEEDDDEPPPPLPVKKGSNDLKNEINTFPVDTNVVPDQGTEGVVLTSQLTSPGSTPLPPLPTKIAEEVNINQKMMMKALHLRCQ